MPSKSSKRLSNVRARANVNQLPPGVVAHRLVRLRDFGSISSAALDQGGSLQFTLDQVPGYAELTNMYDAYSIDKVEVTFVWTKGNAAVDFPCMVVTQDYDDATAPATVGEVGEYNSSRLLTFTPAMNKQVVTVEPRCAQTVFRTGVTSAYSWGTKSQIIDAANADCPHYGLKWFLVNYNTTYQPTSIMKVYLRFHLTAYATR